MRPIHRVGETFGGYEIEESLGRGGMSEVYRAKNPKLGNLVALKLLAPELNKDELFRERFVRESQIAASLDHPNVIPILDAGEADGVPYIAMRYVDGPNLGELIQRGELSIEHAVSIVAQVAAALDAAHEHGLIHRDVKPANVLIDRYVGLDSAPHVYLSDFGVAKHTLSRSGLTTTGQFVGTIDYVAPEQIEGKQVDRRTDVYSLGCVFYECLTGTKPFDRESNVAVMYAHLLEPPPAPSEVRQGIPAELDVVVAKALAKAPEERYATCGGLAAAARAPVEGSEVPHSVVTVPLLELDSGTAQVARPLPPPPAASVSEAVTAGAPRSRRVPRALLASAIVLALAGLGFAAVQNLMGSTNPTAGTTSGSTSVFSSTEVGSGTPPPRRVKLPRLIGVKQGIAVRRLKQLGLRARVTRVSAPIMKGAVIAQAPSRGTALTKGSLVRLTISTGARPAPPPPPPLPAPVPAPPAPPGPSVCRDQLGRPIPCGGRPPPAPVCRDQLSRPIPCRT